MQQLVRAIRFCTVASNSTVPCSVEFSFTDGGTSNAVTTTVNVNG